MKHDDNRSHQVTEISYKQFLKRSSFFLQMDDKCLVTASLARWARKFITSSSTTETVVLLEGTVLWGSNHRPLSRQAFTISKVKGQNVRHSDLLSVHNTPWCVHKQIWCNVCLLYSGQAFSWIGVKGKTIGRCDLHYTFSLWHSAIQQSIHDVSTFQLWGLKTFTE